MTFKNALFLLLLLLSCTACGKPVPPYKYAYIGEWQAPQAYLLFTPEGHVVYKYYKNGATMSVSGPLQGFKGNNFKVGYAFFTTTFLVTTPPYLCEDASWRMVVDGVELVRTRRLGSARQGWVMV